MHTLRKKTADTWEVGYFEADGEGYQVFVPVAQFDRPYFAIRAVNILNGGEASSGAMEALTESLIQ